MLREIGQFEFGAEYRLVLLSGSSLRFRDLEVMLELIRDEFLEGDTFDVELKLGRSGHLILAPKAVLGKPWGRNIIKLCDELRMWVFEYNMMGEWSDSLYERVGMVRPPLRKRRD